MQPYALDSFRTVQRLPFAVLADPERTVYGSYGLRRASWARVLHPAAAWLYLRGFVSGEPIRRPDPADDLRQMGGDFLVDPQGRIRFAHYSRTPADRPSAVQLLRRVT